jgi:hypothetical protein
MAKLRKPLADSTSSMQGNRLKVALRTSQIALVDSSRQLAQRFQYTSWLTEFDCKRNSNKNELQFCGWL